MEENQNNSLTEEINDGQDKANIAKIKLLAEKIKKVKNDGNARKANG